jgi:flagellar basal-body rod protein FlgC
MFGSLDISTSALIAHRTRLDTISVNIANARTILNAETGAYEPFRRRVAVLAPGDPITGSGDGVHIAAIQQDQSPLRMEYDPFSPYADASGYVGYPNVDVVIEQMNALEAARSYEANIAAVEATKSIMSVALQMLA